MPISNHSYFIERRNRLRESCRSKKVQGYLTFDFADVYYLTDFPSEGCFQLTALSGDYLFSPLLLYSHAQHHAGPLSHLNVITERSLLKALESVFKKNHLTRIGFDSSKVTLSLYRSLTAFKGIQWVPLDGFVLAQRTIKDELELKYISEACHITHSASQWCFKNLKIGESELETAKKLENAFYKRGSHKLAFETIVAFGDHSAFPHHVVSQKKLTKSTAVLMDLGCSIERYCSDLTRTAYFGKITPKFNKIYNIVKKAQQAGIDAVQAGVTAGKIDAICREVISKEGYGDYFTHGTGHGVGIDIHEPPRLGMQSPEILKEGMVVTVEPGIYLPNEFGVRIEDSLLVKKNGFEILTK